jgi:predicted nucleic-acid-binding protein
MIAVDTNLLVRVVSRDDPAQSERAVQVLEEADSLWIPKTVLLELEWVLRYTYELPVAVIAEALRRLLGYRKTRIEDRPAVLQALAWYASGLDFADALHLASSSATERFVTFDRKLANGPAVALP